MSQRKQQKRIAVVGAPVLKAHSRFNEGLLRYVNQHKDWHFVCSLEASGSALRFLRQLPCDGALVRIVSSKMAREVRALKFPVVNFSSWLEQPGLPTVRDDNEAKGRLCAEHLLQKGFRHFAVVSMPGGHYLEDRRRSFVEAVEAGGFGANISLFSLRISPTSPAELRRFERWINSLPLPLGLFLADDLDAPALLQACRNAGRHIPGDIAVVAGLGHEEVLPLCDPPLTHVRGNDEVVAMQAAEYLERLITRQTCASQTIVVPVQGLIALSSTDTVAVDDRCVAQAVEFIRANAGQPTNIKDAVAHLGVPRRTLERHFQEVMGTTLHEVLNPRTHRAREGAAAHPAFAVAARDCSSLRFRRRPPPQAALPPLHRGRLGTCLINSASKFWLFAARCWSCCRAPAGRKPAPTASPFKKMSCHCRCGGPACL